MHVERGSSTSANVGDFSLVLGGPLFQLLRRARLSGSSLELLRRRIDAIVLVIWVRFLEVSRLPLAYSPLHPDRMGGIGFLSTITRAFSPVLFAQGAPRTQLRVQV